MAKSEKLFEMLELIKEYPNLNVRDLSRLFDVSERGIYRYLNTLSRAGISIRFQDGGYKLQENYPDVVREADPTDMETLKVLLSEGMQVCKDPQMVERGRKLMEMMGIAPLESGKRQPDEIEIVPVTAKATYPGGTVAVGHSSKPDIINPILTSETISVDIMNLIFSSLVKFDVTQRPVPDLAQSWEVSSDGLVWTFSLRDDVKFHDGHPLTAHDVEFTYRAIMDPKNMSPMEERYGLIDKIETEGDYVFKATLKHPLAPLLSRLAWPIAPRHLLENTDLRNTSFNRHPVGSGPFKLTEWMKDDTIVLDANREFFHKDRPVLDRLIFKAYPDRQTALRAITRGDMDIALDLTSSDLLSVSRRGAFRVYSAPGASYYAIIFNLEDPIFKDIKVRKALDHALDKNSIIANQLKGHSKICTGPFGVNSWAYNPQFQPNPYDTNRAEELLAQAGWRDTDNDGLLDKDGKPFKFVLTVPNLSDGLRRIALAIKAQFMKIGVKVELVNADDTKLYNTQFQAILSMIITGADPDYVHRSWHSESTDMNLASYKNRFVDELLEKGRQTMDQEKRKAIYHKLHAAIHDDYPAIFLASGCEFIGSRYRFRDTKFSSPIHFLTTMKDWQIVSGQKENKIHRIRHAKARPS